MGILEDVLKNLHSAANSARNLYVPSEEPFERILEPVTEAIESKCLAIRRCDMRYCNLPHFDVNATLSSEKLLERIEKELPEGRMLKDCTIHISRTCCPFTYTTISMAIQLAQ